MRVSDPTWDTLKRLHSVTGVVPIGVFLLEHFFTNSHALEGAAAFDDAAAFLGGLPYVTLIEAFGIWLPILFHMVLGVVIATSGQANLGRHGYSRNWHYLLQRVTGLFLVFFILFHTWATRFNEAAMTAPSLYGYVREHLSHPGIFVLYVFGVVAASYHFGNGLFGFAIHFGLVTSERAQRRVGVAGLVFALVLALVGVNSMLGFLGRGVTPFPKPHPGQATVEAVAAPEERP